MHQEFYESCIEACHACMVANEACAAAGRQESNVHALADCISLNMDCAEICRLAVGYMLRDSRNALSICEACADICERCQEECDKYMLDYCRASAEACHRCAAACRAMIASHPRFQSHDSVLAGMRQ